MKTKALFEKIKKHNPEAEMKAIVSNDLLDGTPIAFIEIDGALQYETIKLIGENDFDFYFEALYDAIEDKYYQAYVIRHVEVTEEDIAEPGMRIVVKDERVDDSQYTVSVETLPCRDSEGNATPDYDAIIAEFKQHGFTVSKKALHFNFTSWKVDEKSYYREKDCLVYSPCGCNPLSYTASKLKGLPYEYTHTA